MYTFSMKGKILVFILAFVFLTFLLSQEKVHATLPGCNKYGCFEIGSPIGCIQLSVYCDRPSGDCYRTWSCTSACEWGDWSDCSAEGSSVRYGQGSCQRSFQIRGCTPPPPVCNPGGTSCGACSVSCGGGTQSCTDGCDSWNVSCNTQSCCNASLWGACSKSCGGGTQTNDCGTTRDCNTQACGPWWQVIDGDVQANGSLSSSVPAGYYFGLPGLGGFPGVAKYGTSTTLSSSKVSAKGWIANSSYSSPNGFQNYTYFRRKTPHETTINTVAGTTFILNGSASADGNYWYEYDGALTGSLPLTISSAINLADGVKVILLVTGADLNIEKSINYTSGRSLFVALVDGSINIDPSLGGGSPDLQGFFLADNNFSTGVSTNPLYIKGSVVALTGINFQRDLGSSLNSTTPSEVIEYDPLGIFLFPSKLSVEKTRWKEVAP